MRVLLVEDDHALRLTIAEFLRDEGFDVVEAADGHEAAQLLDEAGGFDVLLTDLEMPGTLDGIDVVAHARGRNPAIAVLVISADVERLSSDRDLLELSTAVFGKPFRMGEIADAMRGLAA